MIHIKLYEDFKKNRISIEDMANCIQNNGVIYTDIVKNYPDNDPNLPIRPLSVDEDGLITVEIDTINYEVDITDVTKIEY